MRALYFIATTLFIMLYNFHVHAITAPYSFLGSGGSSSSSESSSKPSTGENIFDSSSTQEDIFEPKTESPDKQKVFNPDNLSPDELEAKNRAWAEKMNMDTKLMQLRSRDYEAMYADNKKYMLDELKAGQWSEPWKEEYMNPYVWYRNDYDVPRMIDAMNTAQNSASATGATHLGCNKEGALIDGIGNGRLPNDFAMEKDRMYTSTGLAARDFHTYLNSGEFGVISDPSGVTGNSTASGLRGSDHSKPMDFTYRLYQIRDPNTGQFTNSYHPEYEVFGRTFGGAGYARNATSNATFVDQGRSIVITRINPDPVWTPEQASQYYGSALASDLAQSFRPFNSGTLEFGTVPGSAEAWQNIYKWTVDRYKWEQNNYTGPRPIDISLIDNPY